MTVFLHLYLIHLVGESSFGHMHWIRISSTFIKGGEQIGKCAKGRKKIVNLMQAANRVAVRNFAVSVITLFLCKTLKFHILKPQPYSGVRGIGPPDHIPVHSITARPPPPRSDGASENGKQDSKSTGFGLLLRLLLVHNLY